MIKKVLILVFVFFFGIIFSEIIFYSKFAVNKTIPSTAQDSKNRAIQNKLAALKCPILDKKTKSIMDEFDYIQERADSVFTIEYKGTLKQVLFDSVSYLDLHPKTPIPLVIVVDHKNKYGRDSKFAFTEKKDMEKIIFRDINENIIDYKKLKVGQTISIKLIFDFAKKIDPTMEIKVTSPIK